MGPVKAGSNLERANPDRCPELDRDDGKKTVSGEGVVEPRKAWVKLLGSTPDCVDCPSLLSLTLHFGFLTPLSRMLQGR